MTIGSLALTAVALLALSACSDGYPNKGDTLFLAYGMSRQDTVAAMNQIGLSQQPSSKTAFVLLDNCVLEIHTARRLTGKDSQTGSLRGADAVLVKHEDGKSYSVQLARLAANGRPPTTVLEGANETAATQMKWLLNYTLGFC